MPLPVRTQVGKSIGGSWIPPPPPAPVAGASAALGLAVRLGVAVPVGRDEDLVVGSADASVTPLAAAVDDVVGPSDSDDDVGAGDGEAAAVAVGPLSEKSASSFLPPRPPNISPMVSATTPKVATTIGNVVTCHFRRR